MAEQIAEMRNLIEEARRLADTMDMHFVRRALEEMADLADELEREVNHA